MIDHAEEAFSVKYSEIAGTAQLRSLVSMLQQAATQHVALAAAGLSEPSQLLGSLCRSYFKQFKCLVFINWFLLTNPNPVGLSTSRHPAWEANPKAVKHGRHAHPSAQHGR